MAIQLTNGEVFFGVPKTGSTHVQRVLEELGLVRQFSTHKHANHEYILLHEPHFLYRKSVVLGNLKHGTSCIALKPKNTRNFMFVRDPIEWYESFYSYSTQRDRRIWGSGRGIHGTGLKRYYWHPWQELMTCNLESFELFIQDVVSKCPGFVSRMYFNYIMNDNTMVGRQEDLVSHLFRILTHFNYSVRNSDLSIPGRSNESSKHSITWNEELKLRIKSLESPYYTYDWARRLP